MGWLSLVDAGLIHKQDQCSLFSAFKSGVLGYLKLPKIHEGAVESKTKLSFALWAIGLGLIPLLERCDKLGVLSSADCFKHSLVSACLKRYTDQSLDFPSRRMTGDKASNQHQVITP